MDAWVIALICLLLLGIIPFIVMILGICAWWTNRRCTSEASLNGKTVVVTGSSAGIGKKAAEDFATRGARVILACRNRAKAQMVADEIIKTTGNQKVIVKLLDTSSLTSVRIFAKEFLENENRLDVLVLNAGIGGFTDKRVTKDGIELTMATNHFGHFLLVNLLSEILLKSRPSRIVVTTSFTHFVTPTPDTKDIIFEKENYTPYKGYTKSKLFNILMTKYLSSHFKDRGVTANCFCPGLVGTEIFEKSGDNIFVRGFQLLLPFIAKSPEEGAQTLIYLAVSEQIKDTSGYYFFGCKRARHSSVANNQNIINEVWRESEKIVKLEPHEHLR